MFLKDAGLTALKIDVPSLARRAGRLQLAAEVCFPKYLADSVNLAMNNCVSDTVYRRQLFSKG